MAEKTYTMKTRKRWGKGGSILCLFLVLSLIFQPIAFAARSSAGGGKIEKIDTGKIVSNIGINFGTMAIGGALISGYKTGSLAAMGSSLTNSFTLGGMATNYTNLVMVSQIQRASGMAGSYYGWSPSTTMLVSSIASSAGVGFVNPTAVLGDSIGGVAVDPIAFSSMAKGAFVGGVGGLTGGAAMLAIDKDRINKGKGPSVAGQIAGMAGNIYGTSLGKTLISPQTYNTQWQQYKIAEGPDVAKGQEVYKNVNDSTKTITSQELNQKAGTTSLQEDLKYVSTSELSGKDAVKLINTGKMDEFMQANTVEPLNTADLSFTDAAKLVQSDKVSYLGKSEFTGKHEFVINDKYTTGFGLTDEQLKFVETTRVAPDNSIWVAEGSPSSSLVNQRILTSPVVNTLNQWPLIATGGLAIAATNGMGDSPWKPLVSEAIYATGAPLLDNVATVYKLKPSLWSNVDQKLGYFPEAQYERQEVIKQAVERRVAQAIASTNIPVGTTSVPMELANKLGIAQNQELLAAINTNFNSELQKTNQDLAAKGQQVSEYATKKDLFSSIVNVMSARVTVEDRTVAGVYDQMPIYKSIGGSSGEIIAYKARDVIRVDLPSALVGGAVESGLNKAIGDSNSPTAALASAGAAAVSGAVRGIIVHKTATDLYNKQIASLEAGKFEPETPIANVLKEPVDIVLARTEGALPLPDTKQYKVVEGSLVPVGPGETGYLKPVDNSIKVATDEIFVYKGKTISPSMPEYNQFAKQEVWSVDTNNQLVRNFEYTYAGKKVDPGSITSMPIAQVPSLGTTITNNVGQSMYEFGTKSFNMGMPNTYKGQLSEYGWYQYTQNLGYLSSIANSKGYAAAMSSNAVRVGSNITSGNALTVADSLVGLGMAKVVPVVGYKGMPYNEAVMIDKGWSSANWTFYPRWPYPDVNPVRNNAFWGSFNDKLGPRDFTTSQDILETQREQDILKKAIEK